MVTNEYMKLCVVKADGTLEIKEHVAVDEITENGLTIRGPLPEAGEISDWAYFKEMIVQEIDSPDLAEWLAKATDCWVETWWVDDPVTLDPDPAPCTIRALVTAKAVEICAW